MAKDTRTLEPVTRALSPAGRSGDRSTSGVIISSPIPSATDSTLTTAELAERWRVSASHLATLRSRGQGCRFLRLHGGAVRYRLADVEAYEATALVQTIGAAA